MPPAVFWQKYISDSLEIQIKIEKQNKACFITDFYESFIISSIFFDIMVILIKFCYLVQFFLKIKF